MLSGSLKNANTLVGQTLRQPEQLTKLNLLSPVSKSVDRHISASFKLKVKVKVKYKVVSYSPGAKLSNHLTHVHTLLDHFFLVEDV